MLFGKGKWCDFGARARVKNKKMNVFLVLLFLPDTVDVLDGIADFPTHLLLIALHLRGTERSSLDRGHREQSCETVKDERQHQEIPRLITI